MHKESFFLFVGGSSGSHDGGGGGRISKDIQVETVQKTVFSSPGLVQTFQKETANDKVMKLQWGQTMKRPLSA